MSTFVEYLSIVGAIVLGVMTLALFFMAIKHIRARLASPMLRIAPIAPTGPVRVGLKDGTIIEAARIVGLIDPDRAIDAGLPYGLRDLMVLEREGSVRIWIKVESIRWIEQQDWHEPEQPA